MNAGSFFSEWTLRREESERDKSVDEKLSCAPRCPNRSILQTAGATAQHRAKIHHRHFRVVSLNHAAMRAKSNPAIGDLFDFSGFMPTLWGSAISIDAVLLTLVHGRLFGTPADARTA
ncbi:MAG TPA: hypothetical protein VMA30_19695 [Xanthobacteraceae bacterium]|nr:hypothetical protein [Xanthobacteraceae bacterium]